MKKLSISTTAKASSGAHQKIFLYGAPGAGKTHFAGTFPKPLFITPKASLSELNTHANQYFTVVDFSTIQEFVDTINLVHNLMLAGKAIGGYVPMTIVVDNLTEITNMIQHELSDPKGMSQASDVKAMDRDAWAVLYNALFHAREQLHAISHLAHIIWICHSTVIVSNHKEGNRTVETKTGSWTLRGDSKNFIPNNCSILSYMEAVDKGFGQTAYYLYAEPHDIWHSRIHFPSGGKKFTKLGFSKDEPKIIHPHYDDLAPYFDLPYLDDAEDGFDWSKEK